MHKNPRRNKISTMAVLVAGLALILAGCGVGREPATEGPSENGIVAAVDTPLRDPAWAEDEGVVIALREDGRELVRLDTGAAFEGTRDFPVTMSEDLDGAVGENLALEQGRMPDNIYLPKPGRDRVAVVENDSLLEARSFDPGVSPARVALGGTSTGYSSQTLFTLSEDGSTVTSVDLWRTRAR